MTGNRSSAVMAQRKEAPDSLDYFPTPPWAARAFCEHVLGLQDGTSEMTVFDPACGEGHLLHGFADYFAKTIGSDVFDYGAGFPLGDFLDQTLGMQFVPDENPDWIGTNPPFNAALQFLKQAVAIRPKAGIALLLRTTWLESIDRYNEIFSGALKPSSVWIYSERVPMTKGKYDPSASSATSYAWFVWKSHHLYSGGTNATLIEWIPPGQKDRFYQRTDTLIGQEEKA